MKKRYAGREIEEDKETCGGVRGSRGDWGGGELPGGGQEANVRRWSSALDP
jgi:hypothetical protein